MGQDGGHRHRLQRPSFLVDRNVEVSTTAELCRTFEVILGFFQPIDFFGDGPRIPFIAVSKYSRGGKVVHSYGDHASVLKFIERNWGLSPLTNRSRDNLPNPITAHGHPYVPANMPAISDLFDMFDFDR